VWPPCLYKRVRSQDDLIGLIIETAVRDLGQRLTTARPGTDPRRELAELARSLRTFAHAYPASYQLIFNPNNKLGVCYSNNNATNVPTSNCAMTIGSMASVSTSLPSTCSHSWRMSAGGTASYSSGGNVYSCTS
jgi:hypothetical protein